MNFSFERLKRYYAGFVLIFLTAVPLYVSFKYQELVANVKDIEAVKYFFPFEEIDSWHLTRIASAVLTIIIFVIAERIAIRLQNGELFDAYRAWLISVFIKVRVVTTLWTIACGAYILYTSMDWSTLPDIRWLPF